MPETNTSDKKTLSSPEQLDQLMSVTSPIGWVGLLVTFALLVTVTVWGFYGEIPLQADGPGILLHPGGLRTVAAMSPGRIVDLLVKVGDTVEKGQVVARVQSMATYPATAIVELTSPFAGGVTQMIARPGLVVQPGDAVLTLGPLVSNLEAVLYLPLDKGKKVAIGQAVQVTVSTVEREQYGYILGIVKTASSYATSTQIMQETLGNPDLVRAFTHGDSFQTAPVEIRVRLFRDLQTPSGYHWSSQNGPPFAITPGTPCTASIATGSERPVDLVVPFLLKRFGAEPQE